MTLNSKNSKNLFSTFLLVALFPILAFTQSLQQYIPSDATIVLTVDLGNLDKKVSMEQIRQYDFYKGLLQGLQSSGDSELINNYQQTFFNNPSSIGYDALQPIYYFLKIEDGIQYNTILMKMNDRNLYEKGLIDHQLTSESGIEKMDGFYFTSTLGATYAWNDEMIMEIWAEKEVAEFDWGMEEEEYNWEDYEEESPFDTTEIMEEEIYIEDEPVMDEELEEWTDVLATEIVDEVMKEAMAAWASKIINRNITTPISFLPNYKIATTNPSDVHFWMDYSYFIDELQNSSAGYGMMDSEVAMAMDAMKKITDIYYAQSSISMSMNFTDGKVAFDYELFMNDEMRDSYRNILDSKFNKKFFRHIEGGDQLFGYYFLNFNTKKSIDEIKKITHRSLQAMPEFGLMADDAVKIIGIFIDEDAIADLWKGDMLLAVSGMKMMEVNEQTFEYDEDFNYITKDTTIIKKMPVVTLLASYGNEKDIMKFVDLGIHSGAITATGNYFTIKTPAAAGGIELYLALKDGVLVFTNDKNHVANNLDRGIPKKQRLSKNHRKMLCENAGAIYWDIPNTLFAVSNEVPGGDPTGGYSEVIAKQLESFQMTSSKKVDKSVKGNFSFNFVNKGTNSLKQFFDFVNDFYIEVLGGARI